MTGLTIHLFYDLFFICLKKQECPLLTIPYISPMRPGEGVVACIFPQENQHSGHQVLYSVPCRQQSLVFVHYFYKDHKEIFLGGWVGQTKFTLREEHLPEGSFR